MTDAISRCVRRRSSRVSFAKCRRKFWLSILTANILPRLGLRQANLLRQIETRRCESDMAIDTVASVPLEFYFMMNAAFS